MVETKELKKHYKIGEVLTRAVDGVSIKVSDGEFVAIGGKSGSGKSTLLHLLSLLDRPTSGSLYINGEDVASFNSAKRMSMRLSTFGFVFQDYALIPELTAIENVLLPFFMLNGSFKDGTKRGEELLTSVGLEKRFNNLPGQLSGGEQQRVAIARALINKPKILFADEPTANLDVASSENIMDIIKKLHTEGITILMVTHEQDYASRAERVIMLSDGKVV